MSSDQLPRLRRLNANLLYALYAVLEMPTLTEAAQKMALTQPAMSMALRRLRDHFGDELVIYGPTRQLTALGTALRPRVGRLLREIDDTFHLSLDFEPTQAKGSVILTAPEAIELLFLSVVVEKILQTAPGLDIQLIPFEYGRTDRLFERGADVAIVPVTMADGEFCSQPLFDHGLSGLVCRNFPIPTPGGNISRETYLAGRHAALFDTIDQAMFAMHEPDDLFRQRRIVVRTAHYSMLPRLVMNSDLIVTTSDWLAQYYANELPVKVVTLPVIKKPTTMVAQWQRHRMNEPKIRWIIDILFTSISWLNKFQAGSRV
ncbi:LysR family transcriptional regulator [Niveispirillum sp. SYP-B3756]|uniref:LysR family transcriptional regulator n=1 Tax=Niveispirillum sp. SYP-B3756 TaxID=2662178 RepID=UPI00129199A8|nr:LysR family transcriptional regulator [Niveispirillum sp. SYP-B3756]MQP66909.1 LysR family transcriptional regulator [Niveispirillum sp. SYP-B3756]